MLHARRAVPRLAHLSAHLSSSASASASAAARIEALATQDEGGRGIAALVLQGELAASASALAGARRVGIITGFPCLITEEGVVRFDSPQETDGPPGAVAIAKALLALDASTEVVIMTDDINGPVVAACIEAMGTGGGARRPDLVCFPPRAALSEGEWQERWRDLLAPAGGFDHLVAIERAGPATDGKYYTMSMKDMSFMMAPLDELFLMAQEATGGRVLTTGIGDGGNEVGMGKVLGAVHEHIKNGVTIGCVTPADFLVTSSVSNWGGYALAAALAAEVLQRDATLVGDEVLDLMVPTTEEATAYVDASLAAGARDGISGTAEPEWSVDGMPRAVHDSMLLRIRAAVLG